MTQAGRIARPAAGLSWGRRALPVLAVLAGSLAALAPVVAAVPLVPPAGLLMLLGWRLLRPGMWPAWIGLPLGLFDDLIGGQPPGSAALLWTVALLAFDVAEARMLWRDHWQSWALAGAAILFCALGAEIVAGWGHGPAPSIALPQAIAGILCFPLAFRLCAALDRWRLRSRLEPAR